MKLTMNTVVALLATISIQNVSVQSFTTNTHNLQARLSFLAKMDTPFATSTRNKNPRTIRIPVLSLSSKEEDDDDDDDDAWDSDVDYDEETTRNPKTNSGDTPNLGINIGSQLEPLTEAQAQELREEATETINKAFDGRLDQIANMKEELRKDFEKSKEAMRFASDLRAAEQTDQLMNKIDKISADFLAKNEELRTGTKLASQADRNMSGKGMEVGSWGRVGGMNVLTSAAGGMSDGLLGSMSAGEISAQKQKQTTESIIEVDTEVKGDYESRIMVVCDDKVSAQHDVRHDDAVIHINLHLYIAREKEILFRMLKLNSVLSLP